jgi:hypothetical protein
MFTYSKAVMTRVSEFRHFQHNLNLSILFQQCPDKSQSIILNQSHNSKNHENSSFPSIEFYNFFCSNKNYNEKVSFLVEKIQNISYLFLV